MFFDVTVQVVELDIEKFDDHLVQVATLAIVSPLPTGEVFRLPVGRVRIQLDRESAIHHATKMLADAESLPEPPVESDLIVVPESIDVDKVAKEMDKLKTRKK
jgi:hypothetical protein